MRAVILASNSPRRRELLAQCGVADFQIETAPVEEIGSTSENFYSVTLVNAVRKARPVAERHPEAITIGADTVIEFGGECIGKPVDEADAVRILSRLSGREHLVITGVCMLCPAMRAEICFADISRVTFRNLSPERIREYLTRVNVLDKAGAYAVQENGDMLIDRVVGSYSNIVGFPVERAAAALRVLAAL